VAVRARNLDLGYRRQLAVADASFELPAGRVTACIGPNGSGKSTLLSAIAGLLRPLRGTLEVPARGRRGGVAYVLQSTTVNQYLPLTVREAVTMGRYATSGPVRRLTGADRRMVDDAMDAVAIGGLAKRQLTELSGGQRQRAFVAQGLAQDADVLLLDEPITGLDLVSREHILHAVEGATAAGKTVVVSTHDLGDAAQADHLLLLAGRVVAAGTAEQVLTDQHLSEAYGGRLLRLHDGVVLVDDHPHH
jgi:ABC-type Mn2+/Zn2+ transport system ATPase subunit